MNLEPHPIASIFPLLKGDELDRLADDIRANGLNEPIVVFEGKILDGRNRAAACEQIGVTPSVKKFEGGYLEAVAFVWSENLIRRHLDSSQSAAARTLRDRTVAQYREQHEAMKADARKRQKEGKSLDGKAGGRGKKTNPAQLIGQAIPERHERSTTAIRAREAGTNREYLEVTDRLAKERPELLQQVLTGAKTVTEVKRLLKKEEVLEKVSSFPSDKFRVLYAVPPWKYGNSGAGLDQYGPSERHYPCMSISDLCALPVADIAEDNAVLFLWVTSPLLDECWPVIKAWGFEYKTSFVWDKVKHNYGHYNSVRHEFLLVCTRGSCTPDAKELVDSVQSIERSRDHSGKPDEFRKIIDDLYLHGRRIELFARTKHEGWEVYGNEL